MEPAGGRGIVRSSPHTALGCTRPFKVKPTLLSASRNPQGGDDLDCPVKSMWSLLILPKPCVRVHVSVDVGVGLGGAWWYFVGIATWSDKSDPPPTPQMLSQYSVRSSCLVQVGETIAAATSWGSKLIGFRLRAAPTSRHDAEHLGRQQADLFRVC